MMPCDGAAMAEHRLAGAVVAEIVKMDVDMC